MWIDVDQLSIDWLHHRCACVTASHLWEVMARLKPKKGQEVGDYAAVRSNYMKRKIWESVTGLAAETYVSPYMEAGIENERFARAEYEVATSCEVESGGLFQHDKIARW